MSAKPPSDPKDVPVVVETWVDERVGDAAPSDWEDAPPIYASIYRNAWGFAQRAAGCRVRGVGNVPLEGAAIVAVNHVSYSDPVTLGIAFPRPIHWLAKQEVFNGERWTRFFSNAGVVPVNREAKGANQHVFQAALDYLDRGKVVGIFPEGTRAREPPNLNPAKTGVARLAFLSGAPVLPIGLATDRYWPKGQAMPKLGSSSYISFGKPLRFPREPEWAEDKDACRAATDEIMREVERLYGEAREARDAGAEWEKPRKVPR